MKAIVSFFMSIAIFFMGLFMPEVPGRKNAEELTDLGDICADMTLGSELFVLDAGSFNSIEERHLAVSLQGLVARNQPLIYIITNGADREYLKEIEKSGIKLNFTDDNEENWTVFSLLEKFKSNITDGGYTLYKSDEKGVGLNIATNIAIAQGYLPVHESLEEKIKESGFILKEDLTDDEYNVDLQEEYFEKYQNMFSKKAAVSLKYENTGLRDIAIQNGFFVYYIDDDEDGTELREKVFEFLDDNAAALGWAKYEVQYVSQASENGCFVLPSDHSHNNSFLASFKCEIPEQIHNETKKYNDSTKHYCALVFSDGDNIQWIQNGISEFYERLGLETDFPLTWTFSPTMQEFSSVTAKLIYSAATENDYFIAGVSGAGYIHPTEYPKEQLAEFTDITAANMLKSDMEYVNILEFTPENEIDEFKLTESLKYYARYDNIRGGTLSLDPDRYMGGNGTVYFVDDKPFICNRYSLWHPDGEGAVITEEWLKEQAEIINSYPADINSINGYSVINVHPWTISVENLEYFVSQLDDNVQLVTLDTLMTMVEENVPHETATPEN